MAKKARFNLDSPNAIEAPCCLNDLLGWFTAEMQAVRDPVVRRVVLEAGGHLDHFVRWPEKALLLWTGCCRIKGYSYPLVIKRVHKLLKANRVVNGSADGAVPQVPNLDTRANGPAIAAFHIANGTRPKRFGSMNSWHLHHLYSGKFPYIGRKTTCHAVKEGLHFTQSAGVIAVHPVADQMCDEFPAFAWMLRAISFQKFGYDPDGVFSNNAHDVYGFVGKGCTLITQDAIDAKDKSQEG
jgi:hypothetical protein